MFFVIGLTMAVVQGGYVRRLPEHKIKPTAALVSTLVTAYSGTGVFSSTITNRSLCRLQFCAVYVFYFVFML
jgi:hypothetical protein